MSDQVALETIDQGHNRRYLLGVLVQARQQLNDNGRPSGAVTWFAGSVNCRASNCPAGRKSHPIHAGTLQGLLNRFVYDVPQLRNEFERRRRAIENGENWVLRLAEQERSLIARGVSS